MTSSRQKGKGYSHPLRFRRRRKQVPKGNSGGSPLKCKWREFGCKEVFENSANGREEKYNHQKSGRCEFRPSDFCESLRTCDLVTKYPNSTFARRLETFRAMGENLQPIQNLSYSSDIWTRVKDLGDVPVIISKYKNIWADGTCPTQAEFIGCTFMVDAHPNGVIYQADSNHLADLGPKCTPDAASDMSEVVVKYLDSSDASADRDPDKVRYAVSLSFVQTQKHHENLNIPDSEPADFCLQPAGVVADMHIDLKHSIAWLTKGSKASEGKKTWIFFPRTQHNEVIWVEMHKNTYDYACLIGGALEKMEGGQFAVQKSGELVFIPVGWFHGVITLERSILVGSWIARNGYEMLCTLHLYMRTNRSRHNGLNEEDLHGWTQKEQKHFEIGVKAVHDDLQKLLQQPGNVCNSADKIHKIYDQIWKFAQFISQPNRVEHDATENWFKAVVWSKEWQRLTANLRNVNGIGELWSNSCFLFGCDDRRPGGRRRSNGLPSIVKHMNRKHLAYLGPKE